MSAHQKPTKRELGKALDSTKPISEDIRARSALHPRHPEHPSGFRFDDGFQTVDVPWGNCECAIHLNRIGTPLDLLQWVTHIGLNTWRGTTPRRMARLIEAVCERKVWPLWR